jgi:hypothetical protein
MLRVKPPSLHEDLSRQDEVLGPSERAFGATFAVLFALLGLFPLLRGGSPRAWALVAATVFAVVAAVRPNLLKPLNRGWLALGLALHGIMTPIVMGAIFLLVITPIGLLMRAFGRDALRRRFDPAAESYWIIRKQETNDMRNQF